MSQIGIFAYYIVYPGKERGLNSRGGITRAYEGVKSNE